ncbi:MAG: 4-hydroxy-tetrahydrodipicolinate synthase [bacterium]|nr:4-hydroxy-tetrahydrodipicolinate synthase [bacterium]
MKRNLFTGVGTALVTPFQKNGRLDWDALGTLIEMQVSDKIRFLVPCGTTGESPTLSHYEHNEVVGFTVKRTAGRIPVLAGTGSNSTAEAISLTEAAKLSGADGALVVTPYYNKPTQKGLLLHYRELAKIGLPIVLYDIPGRCGGQGASAATILELAHEGTICGLKWASGNLDQLQEVLSNRPAGFTVLSGDDNLTYLAMCLGADGVISVLSNLLAKQVEHLVFWAEQHQWPAARSQHFELLKIMQAMFIETNPIPVKTALAMVYPKIFQEIFRPPLCEMEEANKEKLEKVLRGYGLFN